MSGVVNIADFLPRAASERPDMPAVLAPVGIRQGRIRYAAMNFRALDGQSAALARGFARAGIGKGGRAAVMIRPGFDFFTVMFGLFRAGAVPVLIDPGIGRKHLKICLAEAAPEAFIGVPEAQAARLLLGWAAETVKIVITAGSRWFWRGLTLARVSEMGMDSAGLAMPETRADDMAAILFTSGSTGTPKGAIYTHGIFAAQVRMIKNMYGIQDGEIDVPTFPPFALFDPALGMTAVLPHMDFTRPASVHTPYLLQAINEFRATNMFGSPALLNTVSRYAEKHGVRAESLRRIISAGAPVHADVVERTLKMLPAGAAIHTPYGATEALPVATISSAEILGDTRAQTEAGGGVCVGRPASDNTVRIIAITDDPIRDWSGARELPTGEIGEITVAGPPVTPGYFRRDTATVAAKIRGPQGEIIHRMGDVGYFDAAGRLWYCGRKSHRVETAQGTMFTEPCEAVFHAHPDVSRAALVGTGERPHQNPVICVELRADFSGESRRVIEELRKLGQKHTHTKGIEAFLVHPKFPVDIRHNAKIGREILAAWAAQRLRP